MNQDQINKILELHKLWLLDDPSGNRANLSGADLSGANTKNTTLEQKALISFNFDGKHTATFDGIDTIKIGCRSHPIQYWIENFESIGKIENYNNKQIKIYGKFIKWCKNIQNDTK